MRHRFASMPRSRTAIVALLCALPGVLVLAPRLVAAGIPLGEAARIQPGYDDVRGGHELVEPGEVHWTGAAIAAGAVLTAVNLGHPDGLDERPARWLGALGVVVGGMSAASGIPQIGDDGHSETYGLARLLTGLVTIGAGIRAFGVRRSPKLGSELGPSAPPDQRAAQPMLFVTTNGSAASGGVRLRF